MPTPIAALVAAMLLAGCAGSSTQQSTGEFIDDAAITTKVKARFIEDPLVSALGIQVETFRGDVQLSGYANSPSEIDRAAQIARKVEGVRDVKNDIRLKSGS
jgi:osmotically-inducible protein OsmY